MVHRINFGDRKREPPEDEPGAEPSYHEGGHLSSQPMGALKDYVARDPQTEKPAVVNFPVLPDNPYMIDTAACREIIAKYRPELIILGKSVILYREPVAEIRAMVDELSPESVIMYDMAHVLGLIGPHFQQPFRRGRDRDRLDPQDFLRHPSGESWPRTIPGTTTAGRSGRRSGAGPSRGRSAIITWEPCWGC